MKECPCYGCKPPVRHQACHATCEPFKDWRKDYDEWTKKVRAAREADHDFDNFNRQSVTNMKKKRGLR